MMRKSEKNFNYNSEPIIWSQLTQSCVGKLVRKFNQMGNTCRRKCKIATGDNKALDVLIDTVIEDNPNLQQFSLNQNVCPQVVEHLFNIENVPSFKIHLVFSDGDTCLIAYCKYQSTVIRGNWPMRKHHSQPGFNWVKSRYILTQKCVNYEMKCRTGSEIKWSSIET